LTYEEPVRAGAGDSVGVDVDVDLAVAEIRALTGSVKVPKTAIEYKTWRAMDSCLMTAMSLDVARFLWWI
jgi:hypothetical protein